MNSLDLCHQGDVMKRREFVGLASAAVVAPAFAPGIARAAAAPPPEVGGLKLRKVGKVEIVYKVRAAA